MENPRVRLGSTTWNCRWTNLLQKASYLGPMALSLNRAGQAMTPTRLIFSGSDAKKPNLWRQGKNYLRGCCFKKPNNRRPRVTLSPDELCSVCGRKLRDAPCDECEGLEGEPCLECDGEGWVPQCPNWSRDDH